MIIVPAPDEYSKAYWDGARRGQLMLQRCSSCRSHWHPPGPICPRCQSWDHEWVAASGRGTVHSYTLVHHAAHPAVRDRIPYLVALVDLAEGPRIVSNIMGSVDRVSVGAAVHVAFEQIAPDVVLPQFALNESQES
jgi:uncharacterized OB-fold protein